MKPYNFTPEKRAMLEGLPQPLAVYQLVDGRIVTHILSEGFCALFGCQGMAQAYDDMTHDLYKYDHPDDVSRLSDATMRFATEGDVLDIIYRSMSRDGSGYRIIHAMGKHVEAEDGTKLAYVWYIDEGEYTEEVGEQGRGLSRSLNNALHEESLLQANRYDHLTGLPGMTFFFQLAEKGKHAIYKAGGQAALLYFDLVGMKFYNTKYSFAEGDKLLQAFARLLLRTFGGDNCCRVGSDHFAVYTTDVALKKTLKGFFSEWDALIGASTLPVHVGIYSTSLGDVPVSMACDRAKFACDVLKKTYNSAYNYYDQSLKDMADRRQYVLSHLDQAIDEGWIQVYYQPIVRAVNGRVSDEEALARWIDPSNGFLSPADFIPYLEDANAIYKLDLYVLEQVLDKIRFQREAGLFVVPQSINLSRSDFDACDIVEEIRRRVDESGVGRDKITIEITESVIGRDFDFISEQVARFRNLGFAVWMDDFGSGYSSLDVLQSIPFDLIKFDMSFMKKLNRGEGGKIVLTELMRMATALGVDTICEGVETEDQVKFLQEIGCSKLQGFYFNRPIPLSQILERYKSGLQIGFENPEEADYFEAMGRVNLYDLAVIASDDAAAFQNYFNTVPMGIMEIKDGQVRFARTNQSYRDFMSRFFDIDLAKRSSDYTASPFGPGSTFMELVRRCCATGERAFYDEQMPDGSVVHSFARKIGSNPVTGTTAVAVAVLSITEPNDGATYASIARALAADYYNIYYIDLETDKFIEYSSPVGEEELAMERHGENFFEACVRDSYRIYEEDRELFFAAFSKEKVIRELDAHGVFTTSYRLVDTGKPMYVNMKVTRMQPDGRHIIMGISIIDAQMKQKEALETIHKERDTLARVMALSEDYLVLYTVNPITGHYIEYNATSDYESLGFAKEGEDFFEQGMRDGMRTIRPEDLPAYIEGFTKENVLRQIRESGAFKMHYSLVIRGEPKPVSLRIAPFNEGDTVKLVVGVRMWRDRR